MSSKTDKIAELLEEGEMTGRAISKKVGCTEGYVAQVKHRIAKLRAEEDATNGENADALTENPTAEEFDESTNNFVRKVKIEPDQSVLTDTEDKDDNESEDYECYSCHHVWAAGAKDYQSRCPGCGEVF